MATNMIPYNDATALLTNAGFVFTPVTYDKSMRDLTDIRAFRGSSAECSKNCNDPNCPYIHTSNVQDVTFYAHRPPGSRHVFYDIREIQNAIAGRHKYAGMSFGGTDYPPNAPHDWKSPIVVRM